MFGRQSSFFGKRRQPPVRPTEQDFHARGPEFPGSRNNGDGTTSIGDGSKEDEGDAQKRIERFLLDTYKDERGVQIETLLSAIGALAGFAAQEAIWEGVVRPGKMTARQALIEVKTKDGQTFYFGDFLNLILTSTSEGQLSIWRFVAGAVIKCGGKSVLALEPMFSHCAGTVGSATFGCPTWPGNDMLRELPREALKHWPRVKSILLTGGIPPLQWPLVLGTAAQIIMIQAKGSIDPALAAVIVMEAAISMSKVDPETVPGGTLVH